MADQAQQTVGTAAQPPSILSLTIGEVMAIVLGTGALFVGIGKILWDANQNPGGPSVDARLTARVEETRADREYMANMEKLYEANTALRATLDATAGILQSISPLLSSLKVDDATLKFLKDVQKPGADVEVNVNGVPVYEAQSPTSAG